MPVGSKVSINLPHGIHLSRPPLTRWLQDAGFRAYVDQLMTYQDLLEMISQVRFELSVNLTNYRVTQEIEDAHGTLDHSAQIRVGVDSLCHLNLAPHTCSVSAPLCQCANNCVPGVEAMRCASVMTPALLCGSTALCLWSLGCTSMIAQVLMYMFECCMKSYSFVLFIQFDMGDGCSLFVSYSHNTVLLAVYSIWTVQLSCYVVVV